MGCLKLVVKLLFTLWGWWGEGFMYQGGLELRYYYIGSSQDWFLTHNPSASAF